LQQAKDAESAAEEAKRNPDSFRSPPQVQEATAPGSDQPGPAASQSVRQVTGVVTKLACNPAIQMEVTASSAAIYRLRIVPGGSFRIETAGPPPEGFNPCSSFKGLRVTVHYEPDDAAGKSGKIDVLEILDSNWK
jgi:hypothetical protein